MQTVLDRPPTIVIEPAESTDYAIETIALTKRYDNLTAVNGLDLRIRRGEIYGFLGPNGAGKTTTLRMLLGLIAPTSGEIRFHGRAVRPVDVLAEIGAMIETPAFYPHLSGRDNLRVLATYGGIDPVAIDHVLRVVDLGKRGGDRFRTYSLGMKQRLGIAAALLKNPSLLILDEPTNGLDPAGMADMRRLIRDLADGERTVLVSSHLMGEVEAVCDRVGVIAGGAMVAEGTIDDLRGEERLRMQVEPADIAAARIRDMAGVRSVTIDGGVATIAGDGLDAAAINRNLVQGGVAVRGIVHERRSLEDVFLSLTGAKGDRDDNLVA